MLADIISLVHILVIAFIIVAPFTSSEFALLMHFVGAPGLLLHWATNQDVCALTLLEAHLRGVPSSATFLDSLVGGLYRLPAAFSVGSWATAATVLLWLVTAYRVFAGGLHRKVYESLTAIAAGSPDGTRSTRISGRGIDDRSGSSAAPPSAGASAPPSPPSGGPRL